MEKYESKFPTFTFFGSFYEVAENFDDEEKRKDFLVSLCTFACTGEIITKDREIERLILALRPTISISIKRNSLEEWTGGGRKRTTDYQEIYGLFECGKTNKEISEICGLGIRQIQKIRKEYLKRSNKIDSITVDDIE